jgi:PKD repeat protein
MIPNPSEYPNKFDTDDNLFLVHDSLRVRLLEDYNPGDKSISIEGEPEIISRFPSTGIITLTEQCSDIDKRAISLYYSSRTSNSFDNLELLPEFEDFIKPKKITNVTMNVLDKHHNHLKDSLIAVQRFLGVKNQTDIEPFGETITGRLNFLQNLVYKPRAWFNINARLGNVPLQVKFTEDSYRKGKGEITYIWKTKKSTVSNWTTINTTNQNDAQIYTYVDPGVYDVQLTIKNSYGEDTVTFEKSITARIPAPEEARINFIPKTTQRYQDGDPIDGPPFQSSPKIRSTTNTFIDLEIPEGENTANPGYSYAGELLSGGEAMDEIKEYNWNLGDELVHSNSNRTRASYSIGGYYDLILRVDTEFGSYRITKYENSIDIVENQNLWLFNIKNQNSVDAGQLECWEFGLVGETFKKLGNATINLDRNNSFLDSYSSSVYNEETKNRAKREFSKNVAFAPQGTISSGDGGNSLLFWASGGENLSNQEIKIRRYNAFNDTYSSLDSISNKPWNWASLVSPSFVYFILGQSNDFSSNINKANPSRSDYNLTTTSSASPVSLNISNFENGAEELLDHPSYFNSDGIPTNGYFATYRTSWKDSTGYILRNSAVNEFFRISDFYKTNGNLSSPYNTITRLPDMSGVAKTEGELVTLSSGIFFFNNSGEISAWNDVSLTWEIGRANSSSISFRSLQDSNISNFDDKSNTLLAASDGDRLAYLSFDYTEKTFIKFNGTDLTFSLAGTGSRPTGKQLKMGIY